MTLLLLLLFFLAHRVFSQSLFAFYIKGRLHTFKVNGIETTGLDTTSIDISQSAYPTIIKGDVLQIVFEKVAEKAGFASRTIYDFYPVSTNTTDLFTLNCTSPTEFYTDSYSIPNLQSLLIGTTSDAIGEYIEVTFTAPSSLYCNDFEMLSSPSKTAEIEFLSQFAFLSGTESINDVEYIIKNNPLYGTLAFSNGSPVQTMSFTSINQKLTYVPTAPAGQLETIFYNGKTIGGLSFLQCNFTIFTCYESCATCIYENADANSMNHLCETCKAGYLALEDNLKSCFLSTADVPGYVVDGAVFKKCFNLCASCSGVGTPDDHLCRTCTSLFYFLEGDTKTNCYKDAPRGYYFNNDLQKFSKCHSSCDTCSEKGLDPLTKCDAMSCAPSFLFLEDDKTQCIAACPTSYISNGVDECKLCYQSCATCSAIGSSINHNCLTCKSPFGLEGTNCETCLKNWYLGNPGQKICANTCPVNYPLLIFSSKECINTSCSTESLVENEGICIPSCPPTHQEVSGKCVLVPITPPPLPPPSNEDNIITNETLENFLDEFEDNFEDFFNKGKDIIGNDFIIQIINDTTSTTQKEGSSSLELHECEKVLRKVYKIPPNDPLILVKIDILTKKYHTNQIEYDVYDKHFTKLDLSHCQGMDIIVTHPITNESTLDLIRGKELEKKGIDIYNSNDAAFNDICYPYNENSTDVIILDRRKDIFVNVSFCDENCTYLSINYTSLTVKCNCTIKTKVETIEKDTKSQSIFAEVIASTNLFIAKCYQRVCHWENLVTNAGFWFMGLFVLVQLCCIIAFTSSGLSFIFSHLNKYPMPLKTSNPPPTKKRSNVTILDNIEEEEIWADQKKDKEIMDSHLKVSKAKRNSIIIIEPKSQKRDSVLNIDVPKHRRGSVMEMASQRKAIKGFLNNSESPKKTRRKSLFDEDCPISKKSANVNERDTMTPHNTTNNTARLSIIEEKNCHHRKSQTKIIINKNIYITNVKNSHHSSDTLYTDTGSNTQLSPSPKGKKRFSHFATQANFYALTTTSTPQLTTAGNNNITDTDQIKDLDNCPFTLALRADKRNCCQIYWDFLKDNQLIIRTFFKKSQFELLSVNLTVLIFGLSMDFTLNAIFYTDDIVSERYHNKGQLSFWSSILKSVYSCLMSFLLVGIINCLSGYTFKLDALVNEFKNQIAFDEVCKNVVKTLRCKLTAFFIIESILILCFWYYCSVFCSIYKQSQLSWLEGCGTSFALSVGTTMLLCFFITIIRVCSFNCKSRNMYYTARYISKKI